MTDRRVSRALPVARTIVLAALLWLLYLGATVQQAAQPPNPVGAWGWVFTDVATHQPAVGLIRDLEQWRAELEQR